MHWNVGNCTTKRTNISKYYSADLISLMSCKICATTQTAIQFQHSMYFSLPGTKSQCSIIWSKKSRELRFNLNISGQFNTKSVSSQQFSLTPRTEHQCVLFCDYSEVQAKCRLNIALHFNPVGKTVRKSKQAK